MIKLIIALFLSISLFANEAEKFFWDEVKNTNDIELLKLYKKKYPKGVFKELADIKIKRLKKINKPKEDHQGIPTWLKGKNIKYKYFGVGKANVHFKGKEYQEKLAKKRARRKLNNKFEEYKLSQKIIYDYEEYIEQKKYINQDKKIYILLYISHDNL